jgi:hypothetical protein
MKGVDKKQKQAYREAMSGGNKRLLDRVSEGNEQRDEILEEELHNGRNPYAKRFKSERLAKLKDKLRKK